MEPTVLSIPDKDLVGYSIKEQNAYSLSEYYNKCFLDIKKDLKVSDKNKMIRQITKIIKENSNHNNKILNKIMLDLLKTDETFLKELFKNQKLEFPKTTM